MKIINVQTYIGHENKSCVLVRIDTDSGVFGWGECSPMHPPATALIIARDLKPLLMGQNPLNINALYFAMLKRNYKFSGQLLCMAISGVEIALWDIRGKVAGLPLYAMLGGKVRDCVQYYGSSLSRNLTPEAEADKLSAAIEKFGFHAVKFKLGARMGNNSDIGNPLSDVERVRIIRKRLGNDIRLLVDGNSSFTAQQAGWLYERIREYDVDIYEEPCPYTDYDAYRQLSAYQNPPVNLGEQEWNLNQIREIISSHLAQFISCDITKAGGISQLLRISALCEAYGTVMIPHNTTRGLGHLVTLHFVSAIACCDYYHEYSIEPVDARARSILNAHPPVDGRLEPDNTPGHGACVDEEWIMSNCQKVE